MEEEDLSDGTDEQGGDELRSSVQSRHYKGGEDVAHRNHHLLLGWKTNKLAKLKEDTQVRYILQKYTLDKNTSEKCTLKNTLPLQPCT